MIHKSLCDSFMNQMKVDFARRTWNNAAFNRSKTVLHDTPPWPSPPPALVRSTAWMPCRCWGNLCISRSLLQRIERGDPGCSIGAVFEVAAICGVPLFESDARLLTQQLGRQQEKMALMPKAIRHGKQVVNDDF
jgi:hypothetical protein